VIPIFFLGRYIYNYGHNVWADYWLRKDGQTVSVLITQTYPKHRKEYTYTVDGKKYTGTDIRGWEAERSHELQVGDSTLATVSASHPWFSSLQTVHWRWTALPLAVLFLLFEFFLLAVVFDPSGRIPLTRWFLKPSG
jgi:hypothetical protein